MGGPAIAVGLARRRLGESRLQLAGAGHLALGAALGLHAPPADIFVAVSLSIVDVFSGSPPAALRTGFQRGCSAISAPWGLIGLSFLAVGYVLLLGGFLYLRTARRIG